MPKLAILLLFAVVGTTPGYAAEPVEEVMALERQGLQGWLKGDPAPQLALMDPAITYFHEVSATRVDGLAALRALLEPYRGTRLFDSFEMRGAMVQAAGDVAVLTYQLIQRNGSTEKSWNATQVYQRRKEGWRIIHSHWSASPAQKP